MRKIQHLLLSAAMLLVSLSASAQAKMTVELKNGTNLSFYVSEIQRILWTDGNTTPDEGGDDSSGSLAVDLGLSVKWATMNIGANTPEDYGDYFAWGEIEKKSSYNSDWKHYGFCNGSWWTITKYCLDSGMGDVDNKSILEPDDDVAHQKWGGDWRMPTWADFKELLNNCTWTWTSKNGIYGRKVTGPNGNSIFLPAAGCFESGKEYKIGSEGKYWSSSLRGVERSNDAFYLDFGSDFYEWGGGERCRCMTIRAVCP